MRSHPPDLALSSHSQRLANHYEARLVDEAKRFKIAFDFSRFQQRAYSPRDGEADGLLKGLTIAQRRCRVRSNCRIFAFISTRAQSDKEIQTIYLDTIHNQFTMDNWIAAPNLNIRSRSGVDTASGQSA
jgi:hypothetical protein